MTSSLRAGLPVRPTDVKVTELKAKVTQAVSSFVSRLDATIYDAIATLLLVLAFVHRFQWHVYLTVMVIELALIRSSNAVRERSYRQKLAELKAKSVK